MIAHDVTPEQAGGVFAKTKPRLAVYSHIVQPDATEQRAGSHRSSRPVSALIGLAASAELRGETRNRLRSLVGQSNALVIKARSLKDSLGRSELE